MSHLLSLTPLPSILSPILGGSCCTCTAIVENNAGNNLTASGQESLRKLRFDLEGLLESREVDYTDAVINVDGASVCVHRCILAARSPFFRNIFCMQDATISQDQEGQTVSAPKYEFDVNEFISCGRIGYKPLMVALRYLYGGKLKGVGEACSVACIDSLCSHISCWPVIDIYLEILCASAVFDILELRTIAQKRLLKIIEEVQVEHVLHIVVSSWKHGATELHELCIQVLAFSDIEEITFEKQLLKEIDHEISAMRGKLGLINPAYTTPLQDKHRRRIYKALDSDDIELLQLLLTESMLTIDSAYALHYAASYCDSKTTLELLDLEKADINCRNKRGYTVLHVAAMRRDPEIIGILLERGANPLDVTPHGQTALQISKRFTRSSDSIGHVETREDYLRDKICVEILEQADRDNPLSVFPAVNERELFMRLLYLENRVALAQLLFPREAKVVLGLSQIDGTREFTGITTGTKRKANEVVNQEELAAGFLSDSESASVPPSMDKTLVQRVEALQRAVEVGQRFFPRCIAILNKFMDDGSFEHACIQDRRIPENHTRKRLHSTEKNELHDIFAEAFRMDVAALDQQNSNECENLLSSVSPSSSEGN